MSDRYDVESLSAEARERLQEYGLDVAEPTLVDIHADRRAPGDREEARGGYSPQLDFMQLYEPLFESQVAPLEAMVHEYVHKYQVDSEAGEPDERFQETVERLDTYAREYARILDGFDHVDGEALEAIGVGAITDDASMLRWVAVETKQEELEDLYDLAMEEYERWEDEERRQQVLDHFEEAVEWEARGDWGDVMQVIGPLTGRMEAIEEAGVEMGPEEEAFAYYAGIAAGGHVDDEEYLAREKEEIRDRDRNYEAPEEQVELVEELLDEHRRLRSEGMDEDAVVRAILSRM